MVSILDEELSEKTWKNYFLQSVLAGIALYIGLKLPFIASPLLVAAIGSTAFIVFAMPSEDTSRPRNVLGGHFVCGLLGLAFFHIYDLFLPLLLTISVAVAVAIFVMVAFDIEHPPAGGTVIFFVITPMIEPLVSLLLLASILTLLSYLLRSYLIDLV